MTACGPSSSAGNIENGSGNWPQAETAYKKAVEAARTTRCGEQDGAQVSRRPGSRREQLGQSLRRARAGTSEAEAAYQSALAIWKPLAEKHPDVPGYQQDLADIHNNLGKLYRRTGRGAGGRSRLPGGL